MKYTYNTSDVTIGKLQVEIRDSPITISIKSIYIDNNLLVVEFNAELTSGESLILRNLIDAHVPAENNDEPPALKVDIGSRTSDNVPFVYSSSKPHDHYVCFQGADDIEPVDSNDGIGRGNRLLFGLTSNDVEIIQDYTFNEGVYIKDGYIICDNCPFGSSFNLDIVHPVYGFIQTFARNVPLFKSSWIPLNTEDRAFLPKGIILRITVCNSQGGISEDNNRSQHEDPPSTFKFSARLELFRKKK